MTDTPSKTFGPSSTGGCMLPFQASKQPNIHNKNLKGAAYDRHPQQDHHPPPGLRD